MNAKAMITFAATVASFFISVSSTDVTLALKTNSSNEHWCIYPENGTIYKGARVKFAVGNCCSYPNLKIVRNTIKSADGNFCIDKIVAGKPLTFENTGPTCEKFETRLTGEIRQAYDLCMVRNSFNNGILTPCSGVGIQQKSLQVYDCLNSTKVVKSNLKLINYLSLEYCWRPSESKFTPNREMSISGNGTPCCMVGTFLFKADKTLWLKSTIDNTEWCIKVRGMPHTKTSDLDYKRLTIYSVCDGTAFEYDQNYGHLRLVGTNYCVYQNDTYMQIQQCGAVNDPLRFRNDSCQVEAVTTTSAVTTLTPDSWQVEAVTTTSAVITPTPGPNWPSQSALAQNMIQDSSDVFQMFYIDRNVHKPTFKSTSTVAVLDGVSFEDCVTKCANLRNCQAIAYRKNNQQENQVSQCIIINHTLIFNSSDKHENFYFYSAYH